VTRHALSVRCGVKVVGYGVLANAGIDYCTATSDSTSGEIFLRSVGERELKDATSSGFKRKPFRTHGYEGIQAGPVGLAACEGRTMLRLSGEAAARNGRMVCCIADNVSRIDLQSTVQFSRDVSGLAHHHAAEARRFIRDGGRARFTQVTDGYERGRTLTLGSRVSNYYGRVYDKHRESKDDRYRRCWRYEVECKGDGAEAVRRLMVATAASPEAIASYVHDWFGGRGLAVRYRPGMACASEAIGGGPSDDIRALTWLRRQASPALGRLQERYSREALIRWLFDGATMEDMQVEASLIRAIADAYESRVQVNSACVEG